MRTLAKVTVSLLSAQSAWCWKHASSAEFRGALPENDLTLVAFLGPPQGSTAKQLETEWSSISVSNVPKLSVDCTNDKSLCAELDVVSFPAIRLYGPDGSMRRYRGPRKSKPIDAFLKRMSNPLITEVNGDNSKSFIASDDVVFVAHLATANAAADESRLEDRFLEMAARHQDRFTFGIAAGSAEKNTLQCYNDIDGASFRTSELDTFASIEAFVKKCSTPLIPELTRRNEMEYLSSGKSLVYYFSPSSKEREAWAAATRPLARTYAQYLTFVTVDSATYPEMVSGLGVPGGPAGAGVSVSNPRMGQVFPMAGSDTETLESFITEISQGRVEPWDGVMRQEEEPKQSGEEPRDEL